ncbi:MAG: carboxypeptidase-like regulatory domain-containing protein [Vicinamibacteraceae bacterium]
MLTRSLRLFSLVALLAAAGRPASAQEARATLIGSVFDEQDAAVAAATVIATADETGLEWSTTTDEAGRYRLPLLFPGAYTLRVQAAGFAEGQESGVVLRAGEERRADIVLQVGGVDTAITVTAPITNSAMARWRRCCRLSGSRISRSTAGSFRS